MIKNVHHKKLILLMCFLCLFIVIGFCFYQRDYDKDHYSLKNSSRNLSDDGKSLFWKIGHLDGHIQIAIADLSNSCSAKIHFEGNIKSGKAKLILVKPDKSVEILKEITSTNNRNYTEDLLVTCSLGTNKLKFVGENYSGDFKISQDDNKVFSYKTYSPNESKQQRIFTEDFSEGFPFNSKDLYYKSLLV